MKYQKIYDFIIDNEICCQDCTRIEFAEYIAKKVFEATKQACANNADTKVIGVIGDINVIGVNKESILNIKLEDLEL